MAKAANIYLYELNKREKKIKTAVPIPCRTIKVKAQCMFVMLEFIPKRIHQTHTGSWSLVKYLNG